MSASPLPQQPPQFGSEVPRRGNALSRGFARFLLWAMRWKIVGNPPNRRHFIVTAAPHTSNMDGLVFLIASVAMGLELHWIGKHTLFKGLGGRSETLSMRVSHSGQVFMCSAISTWRAMLSAVGSIFCPKSNRSSALGQELSTEGSSSAVWEGSVSHASAS